MKKIGILLLAVFISVTVFGQNTQKKDKAIFKDVKPGYYQNTILKSIAAYETKTDTTVAKRFKVDFTGMDIPTSIDQFTKYWYQPPISQGNTGTCWCFSTTSFFESEVYRLYKKEVKLSRCTLFTGNMLKKQKALLNPEEHQHLAKVRNPTLLQGYGESMELSPKLIIQECLKDKPSIIMQRCLMKWTLT